MWGYLHEYHEWISIDVVVELCKCVCFLYCMIYKQYTYCLRFSQYVQAPLDIYVYTTFTCMVTHVCFKHFTPYFSQGGLDTEVDLLLQQLEDRL